MRKGRGGGTHPFHSSLLLFARHIDAACRIATFLLLFRRSPYPPALLFVHDFFRFVQLSSLVEVLESCQEFGFDLEAHNARTYHGLTCLLQISTEDKVTRSTVASMVVFVIGRDVWPRKRRFSVFA